MNRKFLKELFSTGLYILGVLLITYVIVTFVGQRTVVRVLPWSPPCTARTTGTKARSATI